MKVEAIYLPSLLTPQHVLNRSVVVFDVLRATTTMTAALSVGVKQIRIFGSPDEARAARAVDASSLLCGEVNCLPPDDFDLGNSPGGFVAESHEGRSVLMATTNGTRAILAAREAAKLFVGALINAQAVAKTLLAAQLDVTLLCAGTNGQIAAEDILGAGAVIDEIEQLAPIDIGNDSAQIAREFFRANKDDLRPQLFNATGGRNVVAAGLSADITFAARLNVTDVVGQVLDNPLRVVRA